MTGDKSFIEVQFPVSKISKESYKERKAGSGQTLTGLGKWWGRKPLIMVRAALIGLLMPASEKPQKDMDIFLKIMTMDEKGLLIRRNKSIPVKTVYDLMTAKEREEYFVNNNEKSTIFWKEDISAEKKAVIINGVWNRMTYDQKLVFCVRPEDYTNDDPEIWKDINTHLDINAANLQELVKELGVRRFGRRAVVGDCFCGGGSVPFEAARIGNDVIASDLNPVAGLLTWASLNIAGDIDEHVGKIRQFQQKVFDVVDNQIIDWGIETNEKNERANSYLYCCETTCSECGYIVPLSPSWVIGKSTKTAAILSDNGTGFNIDIRSGLSDEELKEVEKMVTIKGGAMYCPHCKRSVPISALRKETIGENGLRLWKKNEFVPRESDVFRERLYCIRYTNIEGKRYYTAPTSADLEREQRVIDLLSERFNIWQEKGCLPSIEIERGDKTYELIRTRGWKYWHQLFNPRQLLVHGLFIANVNKIALRKNDISIAIVALNKCLDYNSKLCRWDPSREDGGKQTFYNQAFNTIYNWVNRALPSMSNNWYVEAKVNIINTKVDLLVTDARKISHYCDLWITDPPYADAVNYHELSEFFLVWDKMLLEKAFPVWYADSKRALAVRGRGQNFNNSMVDIYKNLAEHMPDNGMQIVMFTHQDVKVWAELSLILWSANLRVTAAWNIATETESGGLKEGNYVKGTVLLILRKQASDKTVFEDELYPEIEEEVKRQVDNMRTLDDKEDPNFGDADYLLAAYASSLKVLTSYKTIEGMDVQYELSKGRNSVDPSPVERIIRSAVKIAYDYLIPGDFDSFIWKLLTAKERFYIKGIEAEKHGSTQLSTYQELARGFGVNDYKDMLADARANNARLKTASDYKMGGMQSDDAKVSVVRNALTAIYRGRKEENPEVGKNWLRNELEDYWGKRETLVELLDYISELEHHDQMKHWLEDARYARLIRELVRSDGY